MRAEQEKKGIKQHNIMSGKKKLFTKKDFSNHTWIVKVLIIIIYYPLAFIFHAFVWIFKMLWRLIQVIFGLILDAVDKSNKEDSQQY